MSWDQAVPKVGDTVPMLPGGKPPIERLSEEAEIILAQAAEYASRAAEARNEAARHDEMAERLKADASKYLVACEALRVAGYAAK